MTAPSDRKVLREIYEVLYGPEGDPDTPWDSDTAYNISSILSQVMPAPEQLLSTVYLLGRLHGCAVALREIASDGGDTDDDEIDTIANYVDRWANRLEAHLKHRLAYDEMEKTIRYALGKEASRCLDEEEDVDAVVARLLASIPSWEG